MGHPLIPLLDLTRQYRQLRVELEGAITRVLARGCFILGPEVAAFEREFASFCGSRFGIGVASGTDALELALRALDVGPGDFVVTVSFTFLSTGEAIRILGATPLFIDIDPVTYTLDPNHLEDLLRRLPTAVRRKIKAILPVHLYGHPCDMTAVQRIANREGWSIVEDCAQAHGARWNSKIVGTWGEMGCFSFYPTKNLGACGDGGMVVTSSARLAQRLKALRFQGRRAKDRQVMEGRNSRLDELQAALLREKLKYLKRWTEARRRLAALYSERLRGLNLQTPYESAEAFHVYHLYTIQSSRRGAIQRALARHGISTAIHYQIPIHQQPLYKKYRLAGMSLPVTERVSRQILSLPLFPELNPAEVTRVCQVLASVCA